MQDTQGLFERLLYEEGSDTLLFRPKGYTFTGGLEMEKGELLKDVLSSVNAWRRSDTYILLGIEEVKGGRNRVLEVMTHLNEAEILDFVNSRVDRAVRFSYTPLTCEGRKVGFIHIPRQPRPVTLKENFANLKKYVVYVRRGDRVVEAAGEEVADMKRETSVSAGDPVPLSVEFSGVDPVRLLGKRVTIKTLDIEVPPPGTIPDFTGEMNTGTGAGRQPFHREYYRDLAEHVRRAGRVGMINFCLENPGGTVARDVSLEMNIEDEEGIYLFYEAFELPPCPGKKLGDHRIKPLGLRVDPSISLIRVPPWWTVRVAFPEIPPHRSIFTSGGLYAGSRRDAVLELDAVIKEGNREQSIHRALTIEFKKETKKLSLSSLTRP